MKKLADRIAAGLIANHSEYIDVNGFGVEASTINVTNLVGFNPETAAEFTRLFGKNDVLAARAFRRLFMEKTTPTKSISVSDLNSVGVWPLVFQDLGDPTVSGNKVKWIAGNIDAYPRLEEFNTAYEAKFNPSLDTTNQVSEAGSGGWKWVSISSKDWPVLAAKMQHCTKFAGDVYSLVDASGAPHVTVDVKDGTLVQAQGVKNAEPGIMERRLIQTFADNMGLNVDDTAEYMYKSVVSLFQKSRHKSKIDAAAAAAGASAAEGAEAVAREQKRQKELAAGVDNKQAYQDLIALDIEVGENLTSEDVHRFLLEHPLTDAAVELLNSFGDMDYDHIVDAVGKGALKEDYMRDLAMSRQADASMMEAIAQAHKYGANEDTMRPTSLLSVARSRITSPETLHEIAKVQMSRGVERSRPVLGAIAENPNVNGETLAIINARGAASSRVASGILERHAEYLTASGWNMTELRQKQDILYDNIDIELGDTRIACQIADTDELQSLGLQKHAGLESGEGMVFPYDPPRKVSFHMAKVSFPIDIVFINSSRKISRIVEEIEPGTPGSWGMNHIALVVEVPGGFCRENGISVGDDAGAVSDRVAAAIVAQEKFPSYPRRDINPKMLPTNPTKDRFKDRGLPDEVTEDQPMDGAHYDQTQGYDPTKDMSDEVAPVRPMR